MASNARPVTVNSYGQKFVEKVTSELLKKITKVSQTKLKVQESEVCQRFWVVFRSVFWKKYLSRIHAGRDIPFTNNDALWYRTVLKL